MKQPIFQKRFSRFFCRFANHETKTIVELCCLNVGVCSTAQAIFAKLNQFIDQFKISSNQFIGSFGEISVLRNAVK